MAWMLTMHLRKLQNGYQILTIRKILAEFDGFDGRWRIDCCGIDPTSSWLLPYQHKVWPEMPRFFQRAEKSSFARIGFSAALLALADQGRLAGQFA
jgi:hypothetical protein